MISMLVVRFLVMTEARLGGESGVSTTWILVLVDSSLLTHFFAVGSGILIWGGWDLLR